MAITLKGKVVAITGGARGIGLETAKALIAKGAKVSIGDVDAEGVEIVAKEIGAHGCYLDVRDQASFSNFLDSTRDNLGPVHALVNNAGIMPKNTFLDEDDALADAALDINLRGVINGMRAALPAMKDRNAGHIVNVSSLMGRFALPGYSFYVATKFAVVGLTESVAAEFRESDINFSLVLPSRVRTELASGTDESTKGLMPTLDPKDVADSIVATLEKPRLYTVLPGYMKLVYVLAQMIPVRIKNLIKRAAGESKLYKNVDRDALSSYSDRLKTIARNKPNS
ncbi:SDR family oxidoreductase [Maricurvus nonylphenolicus]|uniref:SDR family oxidoreductase n=1 Tax=Maricurvus nonylphenolicus TaxID=1008307 RepID=UPI0036F28645